jgi:serine/threonine-protein kinase
MTLLNTDTNTNILNNRYRIIQAIAQGGFGETFLAEDLQMPSARLCVIKKLKPSANYPHIHEMVKEKFAREAMILEKLGADCLQIPTLYAYFEENEEFYLVQEWIEGQTLWELVQKRGPLPDEQVKEILCKILPVLDHLHRRGIIHRDIKPDNIILRDIQGQHRQKHRLPVLIDFGAVKETMGTNVTSQGGTVKSLVIGTVGFMPAEQVSGRPMFASDLYSLGLTAIYLLTGKLPLQLPINQQTGEILWQQDAPNVDLYLARVINRAIQSQPGDRYPTAKAMYQDLQKKISVTIPPTQPSLPPATAAQLVSVVNSQPSFNQVLPASWQKIPQGVQRFTKKLVTEIVPEINQQLTAQVEQLSAHWQKLGEGQKASIFGVTLGAVLGLGVGFTQPMTAISASDNENNAITEVKASAHSINSSPNNSQVSQAKKAVCQANKPQLSSFYFIADSAFANLAAAENKCETLLSDEKQAGVLWTGDYSNMKNKNNYTVFAQTFGNRNSCEEYLVSYKQKNPNAYCGQAIR